MQFRGKFQVCIAKGPYVQYNGLFLNSNPTSENAVLVKSYNSPVLAAETYGKTSIVK